MDWFVKAFMRASLVWFTAGIALGLAMAIHPAWVVVAIGAFAFVYNLWRTFNAADARHSPTTEAGRSARPLKTLEE
jgi:hypothetical protein